MTTKPLLTRKDIAQMLGDVTARQVGLNEKAWGIDVGRRDLNSRCVRYLASIVIPILRAKGFIS